MPELPDELWATVHELRPVHPCAAAIKDFYERIGYAGVDNGVGEEDECIGFCLADYRAEPDYFDVRHDGKRGCVKAWYDWGDECSDPRLHGGRR